jgi:hypothetical protein
MDTRLYRVLEEREAKIRRLVACRRAMQYNYAVLTSPHRIGAKRDSAVQIMLLGHLRCLNRVRNAQADVLELLAQGPT